MRSLQGKGYELRVRNVASSATMIGPGLVYVYAGQWSLNGRPFFPNDGIELTRPVELLGSGILALAQLDTEESVTGFEEYEVAPGIILAPVTMNDKNWGYEVEVPTFIKMVQLKLIHVQPGHRTSLQYHVFKDEVMLPIDGRGTAVNYPRGTLHRVPGPALYFEASTYHPDDVVRVADDYGRAPQTGGENVIMRLP